MRNSYEQVIIKNRRCPARATTGTAGCRDQRALRFTANAASSSAIVTTSSCPAKLQADAGGLAHPRHPLGRDDVNAIPCAAEGADHRADGVGIAAEVAGPEHAPAEIAVGQPKDGVDLRDGLGAGGVGGRPQFACAAAPTPLRWSLRQQIAIAAPWPDPASYLPGFRAWPAAMSRPGGAGHGHGHAGRHGLRRPDAVGVVADLGVDLRQWHARSGSPAQMMPMGATRMAAPSSSLTDVVAPGEWRQHAPARLATAPY